MKIVPFFVMLILHEQARACTNRKELKHLTQPKQNKNPQKNTHIGKPAALSLLPSTRHQARLLDLHLPPHPSPCECCVYLNVQSTMVPFLFLFSMPKIINANGEMKLGLDESK